MSAPIPLPLCRLGPLDPERSELLRRVVDGLEPASAALAFGFRRRAWPTRGRRRSRGRRERAVSAVRAAAAGIRRTPRSRLWIADRQRQAHRRTPRARGRGGRPRGTRLRRPRLPTQGPREGAPAQRRDEHARRRRPAGRCPFVPRVHHRQARAEAREPRLLRARARRLELSEVLRDRPPARRAAGGARCAAPAAACRMRRRLTSGSRRRGSSRSWPRPATTSARRRSRPSPACARPAGAAVQPRAAIRGARRRQPAHHGPRRLEGRAPRRDLARGVGPAATSPATRSASGTTIRRRSSTRCWPRSACLARCR